MRTPIRVEACTDSVESALAAQEGGADRIELCANLIEGGTTPSAGTLQVCRARLTIPIFVLVRPRGGDFLYSGAEVDAMCADIEHAKRAGADGVVVGALTPHGSVDRAVTDRLVEIAHPLAVTFHRALDMCADWRMALEELVDLGVTRVLTSGQARSAPEGAQTIAEMVRVADGRLTVLPGGGIAEHNVTSLVQATGVSEVHLTGTTTRKSSMTFRTPTVEMGNAPPRSEYEWPQTDPTVIKRVVTALNP